MSADSRRLKGFLLAVVVWLPLAFLGWAVLSSALVYVPGMVTGWVLSGAWPSLFESVSHSGADWQVATTLMVRQPGSPVLGQLVFDLSPMMYGYSLPLFFGLAMATDLSPLQRSVQCLITLPILWLMQIFGMVGGALKIVIFDTGPQGTAAAATAGLSADVVALCYQFGYLILPAVVPVVMWVVLNRRFIDTLGRGEGARSEEPDAL